MNKITTSILSLVLSLSLNNSIYSQGISWSNTDGFAKTIVTIQTTSNLQNRYSNALKYFSTTHGTTKQLQDACFYLSNDQEKYNLCLAAYPNILDKENFIHIYNSFSSFSNAIKLYQDTQAKDELLAQKYTYQLDMEKDNKNKFDLLINQGDILLSTNKFDEAISNYQQALALNVENITSKSKIDEAYKWQKEHADLNTVKNETSIKFNALMEQADHLLNYNLFDEAIASYEKAMALNTGDQTAYNHIKEANKRKKEQNNSDLLLMDQPIEVSDFVVANCFTDESKFAHILTSVEDQTFANEKKEMAKKQVKTNCLSISQMKEIVPL
jgi:tetratricopeptide (TPR) repeat protein